MNEQAGHRWYVEYGWAVDDARAAILATPAAAWARYDSPFEAKWTLADKRKIEADDRLRHLFDRLETEVRDQASVLFGVQLLPDDHRHYAGVFRYAPGDHLGVHVDAGIHPATGLRKHVTAVLYFGGDGPLELWAGRRCTREDTGLSNMHAAIAPDAGRLVLFENNDYAWHGAGLNTGDTDRIVVTVSYLSREVDAFENQRQRAYFIPRPSETWGNETYRLRDLRADAERYAEAYRA